jgi:hypothetical protein
MIPQKIGLLVRADLGGLGNQTRALWDYLRPEVVLLVDLPEGKRRGDSQLHRFAGRPEVVGVAHSDVIHPDLLLAIADQVDTLVTVECLYTGAPVAGTRTWQALNERCLTVLVANPELYADYAASRIILPTTWHADRFNALVVPHPAPVEDAAPHARVRTGRARTFLHVEAPAMLDRNGTELVAQALPHVEEPCTLIVRSHRDHRSGPLDTDQVGRVRVVWDNARPVDWTACYHDADVLVLPRRYGGLSMVVQEAAALGMPAVMTDVDPQHAEGWPGWRIPATVWRRASMRGGEFPVHTCRPEDLAVTMTALARGELDLEAESGRALAWAAARSWPALSGRWATALA